VLPARLLLQDLKVGVGVCCCNVWPVKLNNRFISAVMNLEVNTGKIIEVNTFRNCMLLTLYIFRFLQVFILCLSVQCKIGWAGDGRVCGPDRDLDSWPDYDLGCADAKCRKVRATLE
jgi:hypothetical protein